MEITFPTTPKIIKSEKNTTVFEIGELYPGYGMTLGNALRRVLLSSLEGAAATSIKIKGIAHEFSTIPYVKEDIVELSLNMKQVRFKLLGDQPQTAFIKINGQKNVTAKDIKCPSQLEIINKDAHIATLTNKSAGLEMEISVEKGFGYVLAEERKGAREKLPIGTIALDANFSPIRKVNYEIENMRVGDRTDFNRIRVLVETDGSIAPQEAFFRAAEILVQQFSRLADFKDSSKEEKNKKTPMLKVEEEALLEKVSDLNLSLRTIHALEKANINSVNQLIKTTEGELKKVRGLGEKGMKEIKKELSKL